VVGEILGTLVGINFGATFRSVGRPEGGVGVATVIAVCVVVMTCPPLVVVTIWTTVVVVGDVE